MTDPLTRLGAAVEETSHLLDNSYPPGLCVEAVDRRRIDKLAEEVGEVIDAYGGWVGENPRKGAHSRTLGDVLDELLDVAACALGAYVHMNPGVDPVNALTDHMERKLFRLRQAIEGRATP